MGKKIRHIYAFSFYNISSPSTRFRLKYVLDELQNEHDISFQLVYPGYSLLNVLHFVRIYFSALLFRERDSLIIFQKIYTNGIYANLLKVLLVLRRENTLYDIDDAEYLRFPANTLHFFLKNCASCSVGSQALSEYVSRYNPNVVLLTSPLKHNGYVKQKSNKILTVGWIGDYGTGKEISKDYAHKKSVNELFFPAIRDLDINLRLILLGVNDDNEVRRIEKYFSANKKIVVDIPRNINWLDELSLQERISEFDIGVSPLVDHEFNRAKSAFKLKQYLSCGVPVLASEVGENKTFLKDGVNGFFCNSPEEFKKEILRFAYMNENKYAQLCQNAKNDYEYFSLENYCIQLMEHVENTNSKQKKIALIPASV